MSAAENVVRKSFYLDREVYEALSKQAKANSRSVTKQLDFLLRAILLGPSQSPLVYYPMGVNATAPPAPFRGPDPKMKPRLKAVPSKKLT